jgi:hypothetical protein
MVNTDRIGTDCLHERRVETTLRRIDERVVGNELVRNPCVRLSVIITMHFFCWTHP